MHVGLITYQTGHMKTWQLASRMLTKGYRVTLFAFPFRARPAQKPGGRYRERPNQLIALDIKALCRGCGLDYVEMDGWEPSQARRLGEPGKCGSPDVYLHCTAKIIPACFIDGRTILNCHPGLLPHNRGVDAFKRSIINRWPLGVTLHVIDEAIDRGIILRRLRVPVLETDTLAQVCERTYELQINLLGNFEHHLPQRQHNWLVGDSFPLSHTEIEQELDRRLEDIFSANRAELARLSADLGIHAHPSERRLEPPVTAAERGSPALQLDVRE